MVPKAFVRQYAVSQQIDEAVADQEIVLHYALALLNRLGSSAPARMAPPRDHFSSGVTLEIDTFRHSEDGNFSGTIAYAHANGEGHFELQISYRLDPILEPRPLGLVPQTYLKHVECGIPILFGLDPYEMIGEKIMACNRRGISGTSKDVYDLYLWAQRPFDDQLARRLAVLKAWTDQRTKRPYEPQQFLNAILPKNFRWTDISRLVPRQHGADHQAICSTVRTRLGFLADCDEEELVLIADPTSHRERRLFKALKTQAEQWGATVPR
jgi:hypothetical protein